jgi:hypothetical protein
VAGPPDRDLHDAYECFREVMIPIVRHASRREMSTLRR